MGELLIPILLVILPPAAIIFLGFVKNHKFLSLCKVNSNIAAVPFNQPNPQGLNCRVKLTRQGRDNTAFDVEICGVIHAPGDIHNAIVQISITDITDGIPKPVHSRDKHQQNGSPDFAYRADLGRLPDRLTNLSDWMAVARINLNCLLFPRKGKRNLQLTASILSGRTDREHAWGLCTFTYENPAFGYIDLQENIQRTKTLTVALAFAAGAADKNLSDCELELIKNWANSNIISTNAPNKAKRKLEKALNKTVAFFRRGHQPDIFRICKEITEIAPAAERYDILDLCLHVVKANDVVTAEEATFLRDLAAWLEVDADRFRDMMVKILPAGMHQVRQAKAILGLTSDMSEQDTRQLLNKEYRKWNARVINLDPEIQAQADQMLNLIAEARAECIS